MWPIRSALFVPAHRRDWVGKAIRVSPGAAVLDIEDSVPPAVQSRRRWEFEKRDPRTARRRSRCIRADQSAARANGEPKSTPR